MIIKKQKVLEILTKTIFKVLFLERQKKHTSNSAREFRDILYIKTDEIVPQRCLFTCLVCTMPPQDQ